MYVSCPHCKERFRSGEVETVDIHEDERGWDVVTFKCPECKDTVESYVVGN